MLKSIPFKTLVSSAFFLSLVGCATMGDRTGFISDYSKLEKKSSSSARYVSPKLKDYNTFIVDPVEMRYIREGNTLSRSERAEVAKYLQDAYERMLRKNSYRLTSKPGPGVARVRVAITDAKKAGVAMNIIPVGKVTGAATGGASMELEVIDSVSREQLGASIAAGKGSQFEIDNFDRLDDVKDVIDRWAKNAEAELARLRAQR